MIRGDVAASAAGWVGALHSLIRRLKGGGEGMSVCVRLCVCAFCLRGRACACVLCSYGREPLKPWQSGKSIFAYCHKAPDTMHGRPRQCGRGQIGPGGREWKWKKKIGSTG